MNLETPQQKFTAMKRILVIGLLLKLAGRGWIEHRAQISAVFMAVLFMIGRYLLAVYIGDHFSGLEFSHPI